MPVQRLLSASRVLRTGGLKFDGVDDYVRVPITPSLSTDIENANQITILFWAKANVTNKVLLSAWGGYRGYGYYLDQRFYLGDGSVWKYINCPIVDTESWHFYGLTFDGSVRKTYRDGVLYTQVQESFQMRVSPVSNNQLLIGADNRAATGTYFFNGLIDEVRIYNRALSSDEISRIYNYNEFIRDGLVLCLDFTEGEGNIAYDKSGLGNHGTIYGAEWVIKKAKRVLSI
jgi:hypothetical protein